MNVKLHNCKNDSQNTLTINLSISTFYYDGCKTNENLPLRFNKASSRPWSWLPGKSDWPDPGVAAVGIPVAKGWWEGVAEYHAGGQPAACPLNILSLS